MRFIASILVASIALSSVVTSPLAFAGSESDAKDLFTRGRELRAKGDCAGAIPLFSKAYQLLPQGLGSLRNLAECEEQVGKFASSRRDWIELKRALIVNKDAKYDGWDADADAAAARLAPKVARLTLAIVVVIGDKRGPIAADMPLKVTINGDPIDPKLLDVPLDRDPATYAVKVEGGKQPVEKSVTLAAGDSKKLDLEVELPAPKEDPKYPPPKIDPPPPPPIVTLKPSPLRTAGYVSLAVGGVGLVGTVVAIAIRGSAKSSLEKDCPNYASGTCPTQAGKDDSDRGKTWSTMANVFAVVTVVGVGLGIGLVVAGKPQEQKTTWKLSPWAGPSAGGATLWGAF